MSSMNYKITRNKPKHNDEIYVRKLASYKINMEKQEALLYCKDDLSCKAIVKTCPLLAPLKMKSIQGSDYIMQYHIPETNMIKLERISLKDNQ